MLRNLGVDDPHDGFVGGNAGTDEDRQHDSKARIAFRPLGAQRERDGEWNSRQRVSHVVDQVGQESHAAGEDEDHPLSRRCQSEDDKRKADGLEASTRAKDRPIDEAMRVTVVMRVRAVDMTVRGRLLVA